MQRIFITGGTGFFGKSILDYRLRHPEFLRDAELTILSRDPAAFIAANPRLANQPGVAFVQGDIRTFNFSTLQPFNLRLESVSTPATSGTADTTS